MFGRIFGKPVPFFPKTITLMLIFFKLTLTPSIYFADAHITNINELKLNKQMKVGWELSLCSSSFQPPVIKCHISCDMQLACSYNRTRVVRFKTTNSSVRSYMLQTRVKALFTRSLFAERFFFLFL